MRMNFSGLGDDCTVGGLDANGDTIAYCPPTVVTGSGDIPQCPTGIQVTAGSCVCPAGTTGANDPTGKYVTCGSPAGAAAGLSSNTYLYIGLGALILLLAVRR